MSISISKHVYTKISSSETVKEFVSEKIYPLTTKAPTTFPFIVYKRTSLVPEYTKDRYGVGDTVTVEVVVASDNYLNSINIADEVRKALENKRGDYVDFSVVEAKLISADEYFFEETFIQQLVFSFKTE